MSDGRLSDIRSTENFDAVDQKTRTSQAEDAPQEQEPVLSPEDVIEEMRRKITELEDRERKTEETLRAELQAERARVAEERSRRDRAEAEARQADVRAAQATTTGQRTAEDARLGEIRTALDARKAQMESLKTASQAAFAEGDGGKMATINADMAAVGAQIVQLEAGKAQLEQRAEAAKTAPAPPTSPAQVRDQMMQGLNSQERAWVSDHPEYFDNPSFQKRVMAAANYAENVKGLSRDSREYIDLINRELGFAKDESPPPRQEERQTVSAPRAGREAEAPASPPERRVPAAPAGGSVPNVQRTNEEPVYLTAGDKEMARLQGISEAEYARHKRDLLKEGLIGPGAANRR